MRGDPKQTRPSDGQLDCEAAHPNGRQSAFQGKADTTNAFNTAPQLPHGSASAGPISLLSTAPNPFFSVLILFVRHTSCLVEDNFQQAA